MIYLIDRRTTERFVDILLTAKARGFTARRDRS